MAGVSPIDSLRRHNDLLIAADPVQVTVERTEWVPDGSGGRAAQTRTLGPYTARVYHRDADTAPTATEAGVRYGDQWGVLLPHDADVRAGDDVEDVLVLPGGRRLRVRAVIARTWAGERYAAQAICEEVR